MSQSCFRQGTRASITTSASTTENGFSQHHRKRLLPDQFPGAQYSVPQPQRLLLPHVGHVDHVRDVPHDGQQIVLRTRAQQIFQLETDVEMVLDRRLAPPGDDDDVPDVRGDRLLHGVLDDRLVHQREHFLWLGLGSRQKPRSQSRCRKHGLANLHGHGRDYCHMICVSANAMVCIASGKITMAYVIAEPCIGTKDTACVDACPVDCIHPKKDEPNHAEAEMLYIDPVECIDCGACVPVCPVSAIFALDDLPEKWSEFTAKNAAYYGR